MLRKLRESRDKLDQEYSVLSDAIEDAISSSNSLRGSSQYFSQFAKTPEDEETEFDKLSREIEKQKDLWLSALQAIDKRLKDDETLTDIEKDNLLKQREYINKQIDLSNKWTPAREQFSKSVKTLGDAAKNIISSIGKTVLKRFEDYYLNSYKESFQKVYDSVENTRNTVSARLKLDQGGFSDLQSEIQNEIEELGIESSVTQADVNDALVSLQAAGVTDKDMLKTLAVEQAKLIAGGSSLNLGNEEMIQNRLVFACFSAPLVENVFIKAVSLILEVYCMVSHCHRPCRQVIHEFALANCLASVLFPVQIDNYASGDIAQIHCDYSVITDGDVRSYAYLWRFCF